MNRECIPDAVLGSAPGLEIRQNVGRSQASDGGESAHSVALTTLSNKRLEGIPIVQKLAGKLRYLDSSGKEITKDKAMAMADGVAYYQDPKDPSKGRLRHRGTFVGEDNARTIVSSKAGSDVANIRDLDGHEAIEENIGIRQNSDDAQTSTKNSIIDDGHEAIQEVMYTIQEEGDEIQQSTADSAQTKENKGSVSLMLRLVPLALFLAGVASSWLIAKQEIAVASSVCQSIVEHHGRPCIESLSLSPEIASLLKVDEMGNDELSEGLLESPQLGKDDQTLRAKLKLQAAAEIDRILTSRKESDILGPGPLSSQQREFHRIALLIHPDKGLVRANDERAFFALRLAFAARRRILKRK